MSRPNQSSDSNRALYVPDGSILPAPFGELNMRSFDVSSVMERFQGVWQRISSIVLGVEPQADGATPTVETLSDQK